MRGMKDKIQPLPELPPHPTCFIAYTPEGDYLGRLIETEDIEEARIEAQEHCSGATVKREKALW